MKQFFALYVKELKANKAIFFFLLVLIVGMNAYGLISLENFRLLKMETGFGRTLEILNVPWSGLAAFIFFLSLPFLLAHAFNAEWKSETHYLMFALPVSQYSAILAKVAAVASMGFVGGVIVIVGLSLWMVRKGILPFMSFDFALVTGLILVTYMVFILGLVVGMEGVKFSVKRYRGLTAVAFFSVSVFLYGYFYPHGERAFEFFGQISISLSDEFSTDLAPFVYTFLVGIIFLVIGCVTYEKRAEI